LLNLGLLTPLLFFSRTLEERLELYFASHKNNRRWWDVLHKLVKSYNNTVHSSIDRTPNSVNRKNAKHVFDHEEARRNYFKEKKRYARYRIGDLVRVPIKVLPAQKANPFDKGSKAKWSKDLFKVIDIHYGTYVPMFTIQWPNGKKFDRRFYETELNHVRHITDE
jgi:hypothetical protein